MKKQISLWLKIGSVVTLLFLCGVCAVGAEGIPNAQKTEAESQQKKEMVVYSEITGEISAVNRHGIAVEYSRSKEGSSEEVYLPIEGNVEIRMLGRIMTVDELKPRDVVNVRYAKIYQVAEDGKQTHIKTLAKSITVLAPAPLESPLSSREKEGGTS